MKRKDIVTKLIAEGISEKTLSGMTDKQLGIMISRLLPEQYSTNVQAPVNVSKTDTNTITQLKQQKKPFATYEGEMKEMEGAKLGAEAKSTDDKEAIIKRCNYTIEHSKDKGKVEDAKALLAKMKKGVKKPEVKDMNERSRPGGKNSGVRGGSMGWGKGTKNGKPIKEWVNKLVESKIYPFTSKNEIMDLIQAKMNEQVETMSPMPATKPTKGHNGIPEFMTYDEIKNAEVAEPTIKPTTKPGTKPGTTPTKRPNPYQPGPGINPAPKAVKK